MSETIAPNPPADGTRPARVRREAARVLLLDPADRLLLFRGADPDRPDRRFWFPAGGGIDPGETARECAVREVAEETGLRDVALGPLVWTRVASFTWAGTPYDQHEVFFLARCGAFDVDVTGFSAAERVALTEHRWWTLDELVTTTDHLAPADLPQRLGELLRDGPPPVPVEVAGATLP